MPRRRRRCFRITPAVWDGPSVFPIPNPCAHARGRLWVGATRWAGPRVSFAAMPPFVGAEIPGGGAGRGPWAPHLLACPEARRPSCCRTVNPLHPLPEGVARCARAEAASREACHRARAFQPARAYQAAHIARAPDTTSILPYSTSRLVTTRESREPGGSPIRNRPIGPIEHGDGPLPFRNLRYQV